MPKPEDDAEAAAAHWHARFLSGDMSPEDHRAFEAWRRASVAHADAWGRRQDLWSRLGDLADHPLMAQWRREARRAAGLPPSDED